MSEISFIVERLNQKPFQRGFTLVSFDELGGFELLSLLNDVLVYLDNKLHNVDLREEIARNDGATATRMVEFLRILKFNVPNNAEAFKQAVARGDRAAIYPALHHILSRLEPMKTRAYLARFLVNVEIPAAFLHDEAIQEVYQHYKNLQRDFKETHKNCEALRHNTMQPGELKREIQQLEDEKSQLLEKIANLERKTEATPGFRELYEATSALRREQEEEGKVIEQGREQQAALEMAQQRLGESKRRFEELSASQRDDSPSELLSRLEREVREMHDQLDRQLPRDLEEAYERLGAVERALSEPIKSQSDVEELDSKVRRAQRELDTLHEQVDRARRLNGGDDKLKMFRQQSALISKKLGEKQDELEAARREAAASDKEVASRERELSSLVNASFGGADRAAFGDKSMNKQEFKEYAASLRNKTAEFKRKKGELAALRAETVILNRTESIMKTRGENVEQFIANMERDAGVEGAGEVELQLESISRKAAETNQNKKMTLEEISEIVRQLKDTLAKRKAKLTPQIEKLRVVREKFKSLESEYLEKKNVYENTAVGLESERIKLENDCNVQQQECLREESRFHYLNCLTDISNAKLARVQDELGFQKGEGRLLRDFKSYKDLYNQKIQQQEQLSKVLRKKQKDLKESTGSGVNQRQVFLDLKNILFLKAKLRAAENAQYTSNTNDAVLDLTQDVGGANVMRIAGNFS